MKKLIGMAVVMFAFVAICAVGAGSAAEESSAGYGAYMSSAGYIIPPETIITSSFLGRVDYRYPQPDGPLGVYAYTGHRQAGTGGQEEYIVIGLQGTRADFEDLPPLNVAFVIDKSGSMASEGKMDWVKESFGVFINQVRDIDYVALVVFDSSAEVVFPSTKMEGNRSLFRRAVGRIVAGGGTNLTTGLKLGYEQVLSNFRKDYTNRVLFLTDGDGQSQGMFDMAASYSSIGIHVSTIGLGSDFDMSLMREVARRGGGSSRFISDRKTMVEAFGEGLGRMAVPVARDVTIEVDLADDVKLLGTWAYNHSSVHGREVYTFPAVHLGDYETAALKVLLPSEIEPGAFEICKAEVTYTGLDGETASLPPVSVSVEGVAMESPVDGITDATVLGVGTMIEFAEGLKEIGVEYEKNMGWSGDQKDRGMDRLIDKVNHLKNLIHNTQTRLDYYGFTDELDILDNYLRIFGETRGISSSKVEEIWNNHEIEPKDNGISLLDKAEALFREMELDLESRNPGTIAISGFAVSDGRESGLCDLLDEMAENALAGLFTVVERDEIGKIMDEMKFGLSDLVETTNAIRVGHMLSAEYILTGTIIPMSATAVVFSRIIHVESSVVKSTAQIIIPMNEEVRSLL